MAAEALIAFGVFLGRAEGQLLETPSLTPLVSVGGEVEGVMG